MKRLVLRIMAAVALVSSAHMAMAQSKTVRSEMKTETATVEAIDASTRTFTLKKADGSYLTSVAPVQHTTRRGQGRRHGHRPLLRDLIVRVKQPGESDVVRRRRR